MANIDELKFKIILDDSQFTKKMKEVEELAAKFEQSVAKALNTVGVLELAEKGIEKSTRATGKAKEDVLMLTRKELEAKRAAGTLTEKEARQLKSLVALDRQLLDEENKKLTAQKKQLDIEGKTLSVQKKKEAAERSHGEAVDSTNKRIGTQSSLLQQIRSYLGAYVSVFGGVQLVRSLVRITGEFEAQRVALRAILQDAAGADRIFYQLQNLAVKSPYTFRDLTTYAKQLSAFSIPEDEIYETTKKLADVSAGLGVDMARIILAYGQVRSVAFLRGQEVRQFTEAGIPILAELAKQFEEVEGSAVSTGEVFDRISKRQVAFEMVEEAFRRMTSEGGMFYNMQEVLAETVKGKVSNLQDSWEIMLSRIGDDSSGLIKGSVSLITALINNYERLGEVLLEVAAAYGVYKAALVLTRQVKMVRETAETGKGVSLLAALLERLKTAFVRAGSGIGGFISKINPLAAALALVAAGVVAFALHIRKMNKHLREADKITSKAVAQSENAKSNIHYYIQRMKEAAEGTEEYNAARQAVIDNSKNFISATDAERLSLENVDEVWGNICNRIDEATKLQAMQSVAAKASATKQEEQLKVFDRLLSYQKRSGISAETYNNIVSFIRQEITRDELQKRLEKSDISDVLSSNSRYMPGGISSGGTPLADSKPSLLESLMAKADMWQEKFIEAERKYEGTIARAQTNLSSLYGTGEKPPAEPPKPLEGWRKAVEDYIAAFGGGDRGMKVDNATALFEYIRKGADALNDAREALKHTPVTDADYKKVEEDIKFYEGLSEAIYGKGLTEFDNTTKKYNEAHKERIADLQQEVQNLKEVRKWYDALKSAGLDDEAIAGNLIAHGYNIPEGGFKAAFESYAAELRDLGEGNTVQDVVNYANGKDIAEDVKRYKEARREEKQNLKEARKARAASLREEIRELNEARKARVASLQQEIQNLKEVRKWYDAFKSAGLDDDAIAGILGSYGYNIPEGGFKAAFESYAAELRNLGEGNKAQDVVNYANGKDITEDAERYKEAAKYLRTYHDENEELIESLNRLKEWVEESSQFTDGQKNTILGNIANEIGRLSVESKGLAKLNLTTFWAELEQLTSSDSLDRIWGFYDAASNLYGLVAGGRIGALVKTEDGRPKGYNVTRDEARAAGVDENVITKLFGDKEEIYATAEEVENLRKKADALVTLGSKGDQLKTISNFFRSVSEYSGARADGLGGLDEMLKNVKENGIAAAEALGAIGSEMDKITGVPLGEWAGEAASAVANIAAGNYVQGAFQMLDLVSKAVDYFKGLREEYRQLQATIMSAMRQYRYALEENEMEGLSTIFGDNSYESFRRAAEYVDEYEKRVDEWQEKAREASRRYHTKGWWTTLMGIGGAANALDTSEVAGISADTRNGWQKFWGTNRGGIVSLNEYMGGEWTKEKLQSFYDSYSKYLSTRHKALVEGMLEDWEQYERYLEQEKEYYKGVFNDVASGMADAWIAAFEESGDAAADFGQVMSDVADSIAKDLLTSLALNGLEDFLGEDYKKFTDLMHKGKTEEAMALLDRALEYVAGTLPAAADKILEWRDLYHNYEDEDSTASLGSGIKSITEDTADLLASYLNAIRADVSYGKLQWERIAVAVEGQGTRYVTLNDYMQQVAANTFDTARNAERILAQMQGFVRDFSLPSGYGESLKVQVVN